jgi:phospholipase/carboxylesterase
VARDATDLLVAVLRPVLQGLDALDSATRSFDPRHPEALDALFAPALACGEELAAFEPVWPAELAPVGTIVDTARRNVLAACGELEIVGESGDLNHVFRALRYVPMANEALYPLAAGLGPVNRHFLPPALRADDAVQERVAGPPRRPDVGVFHVGAKPGARGGFSLYVPEFYTPDEPLPLVVAMHGGSGNGRDFLWTWLRDARGYGAILASPTAVGRTWALSTEDVDTPTLLRILRAVSAQWSVDTSRLLLTGISDGGTFSYVSGLAAQSPFTHLAPIAASFHPFLAAAADPDRLTGLPVFLVHGVRDWMFPVDVARLADNVLSAAGADVTYREIRDLGHAYPREINAEILAWLKA